MENQKNNNGLKAVILLLTLGLIGSLYYNFKLSNETNKLEADVKNVTTEKGNILKDLEEIEFIETIGKTNDTRYIIHKSKLTTPLEERNYLLSKKQEKQKQIETVLRYLEEFGEIDNERAREVLLLPFQAQSNVSRLFRDMIDKELIEIARRESQKTIYCRKK